jgi:phytoene/squalene synthetase
MRVSQYKAILELLGTELDALMMSVNVDMNHFVDLVDSFEYYLDQVDADDWPLGSTELAEYRDYIMHSLLVDYMRDGGLLDE